jgi:hypothetical protein
VERPNPLLDEAHSLTRLAAQNPPQPRRRKAAGVAFSVAAHLGALALILFMHHEPPAALGDGPSMMVSLVDGLQNTPAPAAPAAQAKPEVKKEVVEPPKKTKSFVRKAKVVDDDDRVEADEEPAPVLSEAQLASAATAESGGGSGGAGDGSAGGGGKHCNMAQLLQTALRHDVRVQSAISGSTGSRNMFVWNGDWVRSTGQDGKGLAALREAILWEVGFAPESCRKTPMHGLVSISLHEGAGAPRVVLGQGAWRWQDILGVRD